MRIGSAAATKRENGSRNKTNEAAIRQFIAVGKTKMVIPDTFEKEKWVRLDKKDEKPEKINIQAKLEAMKQQQQDDLRKRELTVFDKIELKYGSMLETLDELQSKHRDFDKYTKHILR